MGTAFNTGPYNAAADVFRSDSDPQIHLPRQRFQFQIEIGINPNITVPGLEDLRGQGFVFHRVQSATLPDYQHNLVPVNQYNRIRYVPTRLTPTPVNITFYDTRDNAFQNILEAYNRHYFHGSNLNDRYILNYDALAQDSVNVYGTQLLTNSTRFFFDRINIRTRDTAVSGREIICYNPTITTVNHDMVNYSDSNPVVWQVAFQPEHINIQSVVIDSNGFSRPSTISNS